MKTALRALTLIVAALIVAGMAWGVVTWQDGRALEAGESRPALELRGSGRGPASGEGPGRHAGEGRLLTPPEGGEHRGDGEAGGRDRADEGDVSWAGLSELGHNLLVIGLIGAAVIVLSIVWDVIRRASARRRVSRAA